MTEENPIVAEASAPADEKPAPKKRVRRSVKKAAPEAAVDAVPAEDRGGEAAEQPAPEEKPKRRPGRPRKAKATEEAVADVPAAADAASSGNAAEPVAEAGAEKPKRRPARARKPKATDDPEQAQAAAPEAEHAAASEAPVAAGDPAEPAAEKPKRRPGRPRKAKESSAVEESAAHDVEELNRIAREATSASSEPTDPPASTVADADAAARGSQPAAEGAAPDAAAAEAAEAHEVPRAQEAEQGGRRARRNRRNKFDREGSDDARQQGQGGNQNAQGNGQGAQGGNQNAQGNGRNGRKNRNKRNREVVSEPSLSLEEVAEMKVADLRSKAAELGVEYVGLRKPELVEAVYAAAARAEGFRSVDGILEIGNEGFGWLRTGNYMEGDDDCFVHQQMIRNLGLRPGDRVAGTVGPGRGNAKYPPLVKVATVNGHAPEGLKARPRFRDLTPVFPDERLVLEHGKDSITGRAIDLVSPIGKGQRGLIVSPPKAGKTTCLKKICQSIALNNPEVHLFCLLVDERPEEVTDMERSIKGEVVASTFDMPADNHTHVSELVIEHAKRLVELGEDVVVVLDSITRLARAYNLAQPASGRILSGGVDSAALYPPKKFLGAARNIENGGSLTIIASALVDTGSKMDEVIFEEFKGTGNMELKLDRELADKRIFPAIDPVSSGTRNEDLLIPVDYQPFVWGIRRILANMNNTERAANALVKGLKGTNDNREFLIKSAKKAQQTDYIA
ncbi:MAG: transcription termination factor Rho [Coriobacteriia bacterium]|nr:transcription termination factor Rho [Coriobacteriia bacterium]